MSDEIDPWWEQCGPDVDLPQSGDEATLQMHVEHALRQGNLKPLATFLRRGCRLNETLQHLIANMIEGGDVFRIEVRRKGKAGRRLRYDKWLRDQEIRRYVRLVLPQFDNKLEAAVSDAVRRFGEDRSVVMNAWSSEPTPPFEDQR